ncbi:MAG: FkbM family methyltransferase [Verrucomicrobia bacterium]|nr:FkbM family methyltransferase [Verrucomicrobiota bacterium]
MVSQFLKAGGRDLFFTLLEIGAAPADETKEPFYPLLEEFPSSRLLAFEVDPALCARLCAKAPKNVTFHPCALGRADEERDFFVTRDPLCCSLYKPNEPLIALFHDLEGARLQRKTSVHTISLDHFAAANAIPPVDFIKMDIQGAELDVLQGGTNTLQNVLAVCAEVEFAPIYENQPLFGDVTAFLGVQGFSFHRFLWFHGRCVKPIQLADRPSQYLWADAIYVRDLLELGRLTPDQLLKLAVLLEVYGSPDVAHLALRAFDAKGETHLAKTYLQSLLKLGPSSAIRLQPHQ